MRRFASLCDMCSALGCGDGGLTTGQTDKTSIEIIQPGTQYGGAIPGGISGDKHHLDLFPDLRGQLLQAARDIGHVEWTLIGTMSIAKNSSVTCLWVSDQKSNDAPDVSVRVNFGFGSGGVT